MSDEIFLIDDHGGLSPLRKQPYDRESILQELLARFPEVLSGSQIDPADPRRWLLVSRELGVPASEAGSDRWALDHLFLDQDGIPTLVEVKRSTDTRLRREVVGQMLDYAANAVLHWPVDRIISEFRESCTHRRSDPDAVLEEFLGDASSADEFWQQVKTHLQAGKIRLIFVADIIPPELARIIEFLNEQMDPAEVLAVELPQFAGPGVRTLVPRVIGITAESTKRKTSTARWQPSPPDAIWAELKSNVDAETFAAAHQLHDWIQQRTGHVEPTSNGFIVCLADQNRSRFLFKIAAPGYVSIWFRHMRRKPPFSSVELRLDLAKRLNAVPGISIPLDKVDGMPKIPMTSFKNAKTVQGFLAVMDWALQQIHADQPNQ